MLVGIVVASDKNSYGPKDNDTAPSAASELYVPLACCGSFACLLFFIYSTHLRLGC